MFTFGQNDEVAIDESHCSLIYGLVVAQKPRSILEFGLGAGASTDAILRAIAFNQNFPEFVLVDNWVDFGGVIPVEAERRYSTRVRLVNSSERDYVFNTTARYDLIISDADHSNSEKWFARVYHTLLNPGGVLAYHDISNSDFPNLNQIYVQAKDGGLHHRLFNVSSRGDERCERGFLLVFKD